MKLKSTLKASVKNLVTARICSYIHPLGHHQHLMWRQGKPVQLLSQRCHNLELKRHLAASVLEELVFTSGLDVSTLGPLPTLYPCQNCRIRVSSFCSSETFLV